MHETFYVWLGSKRAKKRSAGAAAQYLDQAAHAQLPTPAGITLLDDAFQDALSNQHITLFNEQVILHDAVAITNYLFETGFSHPLLIYPATDSSHAPEPIIDLSCAIPPTDDQAIAQAICAGWTQTLTEERHDLLIIEVVPYRNHGVLVSHPAFEDDLVFATGGDAPHYLPMLSGGERPNSSQQGYRRRLQLLLRGVRRTLGREAWEVMWADDGAVCWLMGLKPAGSTIRHQDAYFDPAWETYTGLPYSTLLADCISQALTQRNLAHHDAIPLRPLLRFYHGRLLLNLSLISEQQRRHGLSTVSLIEQGGATLTTSPSKWQRRLAKLFQKGQALEGLAEVPPQSDLNAAIGAFVQQLKQHLPPAADMVQSFANGQGQLATTAPPTELLNVAAAVEQAAQALVTRATLGANREIWDLDVERILMLQKKNQTDLPLSTDRAGRKTVAMQIEPLKGLIWMPIEQNQVAGSTAA